MLAANNWQGNYTGTRQRAFLLIERGVRRWLPHHASGGVMVPVSDACVFLYCRVRPERQELRGGLERDRVP